MHVCSPPWACLSTWTLLACLHGLAARLAQLWLRRFAHVLLPCTLSADESSLKWPLAELRHWLRLAIGGSKRQAEDLLAELAHISCFGIE